MDWYFKTFCFIRIHYVRTSPLMANNIIYFVRYGAQHPIVVLKDTPTSTTGKYVVVGHCCESGDLFSCAPGEPEVIAERLLTTPQVRMNSLQYRIIIKRCLAAVASQS